MNTPAPIATSASPETRPPRRRKWILLALTLFFLLCAALYAYYWESVLRWRETTDDAYVAGHVVQITPQVGGAVKAVRVNDTDTVRAGETLVELDAADSQVALDQAEAALAQTVRETRARYINDAVLRAQMAARRVEADRLRADVARRMALVRFGAIAGEEMEHARNALKAAEAQFVTAREQLAANRVLTEGAEPARHPNVLHAAAKVEDAWLSRSRMRIAAPVAGQVAKRNVQAGQRVAAGAPLMALIPLDQLWVEANFKEVQLGRMRVGQPVSLSADYYGGAVRYRGCVAGFAAGTGSAFALLPAQNATGNWIKIVQRLPVRIALEPEDLAAHPLRIGLSMRVTVDLRDHGGAIVAAAPVRAAMENRLSSDDALLQARARIAEIIRENDPPLRKTRTD
ncbi:MAG: efflux RND transporter periplasmic adaptor subunit [Azoarcus sp.]|jgi:membrane fusion protein (multidrug efflux system)|nr:efflux RND transporter periplasmic adaptor subunit [Azoarcus sp.]